VRSVDMVKVMIEEKKGNRIIENWKLL